MLFHDFRLGVLTDDGIYDAPSAVADIPCTRPHDLMRGLIRWFDVIRTRMERATPGRTSRRVGYAQAQAFGAAERHIRRRRRGQR
jgi:hypothetical protein